MVQRHDIVTLKADFTNESPEIKKWLEKFGSISIPLTVIFPADRPHEPIVLRDVYRQPTLLQKLKDAVGPEADQTVQAASR